MSNTGPDELQWLQIATERSAPLPDFDVTDDVMRTLRERRSTRSHSQSHSWSHFGLLAVALAGWALAAVSVLIAQQSVAAWQDPLNALLRF